LGLCLSLLLSGLSEHKGREDKGSRERKNRTYQMMAHAETSPDRLCVHFYSSGFHLVELSLIL
jgi:hypothetical protein